MRSSGQKRRYLALATIVTVMPALAGCGGPSYPAGAVTEHAAGTRFSVHISGPADRAAGNVRVDLPLMAEATASVFDTAAFPGPADPFDHALAPGQECAMWTRQMPLLHRPDPDSDIYFRWIDGGGGIPRFSLFTIGYHIAMDYLRRHPHVTMAALTALPAKAILDGSHYQPCPG
jgi:hypothetical protein